MSIQKMKKLTTIVLKEESENFIKALYSLGCVQIEKSDPEIKEAVSGIEIPREENTTSIKNSATLSQALVSLEKYFPAKVGLFDRRKPVTESALFDENTLSLALSAASEICAITEQIETLQLARNKSETRILSLLPWKSLDTPLESKGLSTTAHYKGVMPSMSDVTVIISTLEEQFPLSSFTLLSTDAEQHYVSFLAHNSCEEDAVSFMKSKGFMQSMFTGLEGSPTENIARIREEIELLKIEISELILKISEKSSKRASIEIAIDAFTQRTEQEALLGGFSKTWRTVILTGWITEKSQPKVEKLLANAGCGWSISEPIESDPVPTALDSNPFSNVFNAITGLYGTPTYNSIIDPNPFVSFFYFIFFGFIIGDVAYGAMIFFGCLIYLKKKKPVGGMQQMATLFMYCGISGMIVGVLTGGYLSDGLFVLTGISIPPILFNPVEEPTKLFNLSLAMGAVQLATGMGLSAYRAIKQGRPMDAFCDVGLWYIFFAGLGAYAVGTEAGMYIAGFAAVLMLLLGGRHKKGIGKIFGGLGQLYGITGFLSDLFSYARIMALCLAGSVIGEVVNQISTMGEGITGIILFIPVFFIGHTFNLALSLLGAYVHAGRLQYLEFFGRFFEDGGIPFEPRSNNTKYVEIIKEDI